MKTTTAIITVRTASEVHGTGADTIRLGIHGVSHHGDITDGMILGIMEDTGDGTTRGSTADGTEDGTILGTTEDITAVIGDGMTHGTALIMDGTTRSGDTIITGQATSEDRNMTTKSGTVQDTRQDQTGFPAADRH